MTFRYTEKIEPAGNTQFGLVAEDAEKVDPDSVLRGKEGKPYTVRYDQVNAMLLNEFLKEHSKVRELEANASRQEASIARQQKQIEALTQRLQKLNARVERNKLSPQTVLNDH